MKRLFLAALLLAAMLYPSLLKAANVETGFNKYAALEQFMPELVKGVNSFDMRAYKKAEKKYLKDCPKVVKSSITNGQKNVPYGKQALVISYSKPMDTRHSGIGASQYGGDFIHVDQSLLPPLKWSDDHKTLTIYLDLEPGHTYGFGVMNSIVTSEEGRPLKETYSVTFTTKQQ